MKEIEQIAEEAGYINDYKNWINQYSDCSWGDKFFDATQNQKETWIFWKKIVFFSLEEECTGHHDSVPGGIWNIYVTFSDIESVHNDS